MKLDTYFSFFPCRVYFYKNKSERNTYHQKFVSIKMTSCQIAEIFARYGSVDVKPLNSKGESLVTVRNYRTERDILLAFQNDTRLQVIKYNPWKHDSHLRSSHFQIL